MTRSTHRSIFKAVEAGKLSSISSAEMEEGKRYIGKAFGLFTKENGLVYFESSINGAVYNVCPIHTALFREYKEVA